MANDTENTSMAAVFSSSNHDAEMEAMTIKSVLDASGIPAVVTGSHILPNLEFQVQVPEEFLDQARTIIRDARQDGRRAAAEAEAETEGA